MTGNARREQHERNHQRNGANHPQAADCLHEASLPGEASLDKTRDFCQTLPGMMPLFTATAIDM
jgi:hypothetical protein